jgi:homoserine dehydrogenase
LEGGGTAEADCPLYVLKFGGSVLRSVGDLPRVAGEIYRQRRAGGRVVAVVSALAGDTDHLFGQAASVTGLASCRGVPDLVSLGEERTAALLRLACDRIGLRAEICGPEELGIRTAGDPLNAEPTCLEADRLLAKLRLSGVVIAPGFVGIGPSGERALLGRGGSDFSAIFIAGELKADCVRLYKDVDGVFEQDPARFSEARRYSRINWEETLRIARPLIQPKAVEYAAARRLPIEVEALGSADPTRVGPYSSAVQSVETARPLRVSIAGFGVVGQALAERLRSEAAFETVAILVRDTERPRFVAPPVPLTSDSTEFLACETDIIVDVLSCEATGSILCNAVLPKGVDVVSASKRVISIDHARLVNSARQGGSQLLYSAAVGGSAAVLETIDRARADGPIAEVIGVLNGTVNFILQRLSQGLDFKSALREAQEKGFAEENPDADLSGADAAAKLRLIAHRALGIDPQSVDIDTERLNEQAAEGIRATNERWVQVARVTCGDGEVRASVTLQPLREVEALPAIFDEWNCAAVKLQDGRIYRCLGRGAGGAATAEAITADLYELLAKRNAKRAPALEAC